jgi:foldase protein PrsA
MLAVVSALIIAACGGPGSTAANVNGTKITVGEVEGLIAPTETEPISQQAFARDLSFLIEMYVTQSGALDEFGIEVTDAEVAAEETLIVEANSNEGESREQMLQRFSRTESFLNKLARLSVTQQKMIDRYKGDVSDPTETQVDAARSRLTEVCASHILFALDDEETAEEVLQDIIDGADFAEMAEEHGTDGTATRGGDLGCVPPTNYVAPFRDATLEAPVGEVNPELVESEFGWHIILVRERTVPSDDEIKDSLLEEGAFGLFQQWRLAELTGATVTVNRRFGTWATTPQPGVVPPAA